MAVTDAVSEKAANVAHAVEHALEGGHDAPSQLTLHSGHLTTTDQATGRATRQEMSDAKLPLAYRDSCANLLIPLKQCRHETYYIPWKCSVCLYDLWTCPTRLMEALGRAALI